MGMWEKGNQKSSVEAEFFWRSGGDSCFLSGIQRLDSENVKVCIAIKIAKIKYFITSFSDQKLPKRAN
jgi:hypothetical protein